MPPPTSRRPSNLRTRPTAILTRARAAEPENERVLRWLVMARNLQAQFALAQGDSRGARTHAAQALALLEPAWKNGPNEVLRLVLANNRILSGESAKAAGDDAAARADWQQAEQLLTTDARDAVSFERLDPLVRTLLHLDRAAEARPHQQRLIAAGYVPLRPFPAADRIATQ